MLKIDFMKNITFYRIFPLISTYLKGFKNVLKNIHFIFILFFSFDLHRN
jgi:hypothetical protein